MSGPDEVARMNPSLCRENLRWDLEKYDYHADTIVEVRRGRGLERETCTQVGI